MTEEQLSEINKWLRSNPGVFCTRDEITVWKAAHMASGAACRLADFQAQVKRAGVDVRSHPGGFLLDCSDGHLLVALGIE